eukprot:CAMPEP_0114320894 /NCGR_PEP_ID=MMETSP0059-20121206/26236_1 /TAXON_ID=36894 /ORGANISM="Pyramimonas parkeae, Strain CCMP726" /LENGTH=243 /DNA_ID=CAMNT_0001448435 /DNA_START=84 /DNA_END=812 /DNA_ORIENTATION=-
MPKCSDRYGTSSANVNTHEGKYNVTTYDASPTIVPRLPYRTVVTSRGRECSKSNMAHHQCTPTNSGSLHVETDIKISGNRDHNVPGPNGSEQKRELSASNRAGIAGGVHCSTRRIRDVDMDQHTVYTGFSISRVPHPPRAGSAHEKVSGGSFRRKQGTRNLPFPQGKYTSRAPVGSEVCGSFLQDQVGCSITMAKPFGDKQKHAQVAEHPRADDYEAQHLAKHQNSSPHLSWQSNNTEFSAFD